MAKLFDILLPAENGITLRSSLKRYILLVVLLFLFACSSDTTTVTSNSDRRNIINTDCFNEREVALQERIMVKLVPVMEQQFQSTEAIISFDELLRPLDTEETGFLQSLLAINPESLGINTPYLGFGGAEVKLIQLDQTRLDRTGNTVRITSQYLPEQVYTRYEEMMSVMQLEIGRRLNVASGHRSGAYQLYLFLQSLPRHDWSVQETAHYVAFPGYSEHGDVSRQALDFDTVDETSDIPFENLPEYLWLTERAACFGFALSYPPNSSTGISFEPWHWHFENTLNCVTKEETT